MHKFVQCRTAELHIGGCGEPGINKARIGPVPPGILDGAVATTGIPPEPGAGDDAAADAGHQAAAALEPRPRRLCRERARTQPAARARQRGRGARRRPKRGAPTAAIRTATTATASPPTGTARSSRPAAAPWKQGLGTELENVFPDDGGSKSSAAEIPPPAYSEWSAPARGRRRTGLQSRSLRHRRDDARRSSGRADGRWRSPIRRGRMIGQYLIDMVDEAGYLTGDLDDRRRKARRAARGSRSGAGHPADASIRPASARAILPNVSRSSSRSATASIRRCRRWSANLDLLAKRDLAGLRRICGVSDEDLADMIAEIRKLNPKPGLAFGSTLVQPIVPDVFVRAGAGRHMAGRAEFRHAAESSDQPALLRAGRQSHAQRQGQGLHRRMSANARPGWCARSISAPRPS